MYHCQRSTHEQREAVSAAACADCTLHNHSYNPTQQLSGSETFIRALNTFCALLSALDCDDVTSAVASRKETGNNTEKTTQSSTQLCLALASNSKPVAD